MKASDLLRRTAEYAETVDHVFACDQLREFAVRYNARRALPVAMKYFELLKPVDEEVGNPPFKWSIWFRLEPALYGCSFADVAAVSHAHRILALHMAATIAEDEGA